MMIGQVVYTIYYISHKIQANVSIRKTTTPLDLIRTHQQNDVHKILYQIQYTTNGCFKH